MNLKRLDSPVKREHFKVLGIVLALGHTLAEICLMGILPVSHPFINTVITILVLFGLQGVVFLILKRFLLRYYASHSLEEAVSTDFEPFFARYGISKREGEIIRLMIKGHSNREIEEELFISLETVKKHIFNIYKKTGKRSC